MVNGVTQVFPLPIKSIKSNKYDTCMIGVWIFYNWLLLNCSADDLLEDSIGKTCSDKKDKKVYCKGIISATICIKRNKYDTCVYGADGFVSRLGNLKGTYLGLISFSNKPS